jgi:hypothetical protein
MRSREYPDDETELANKKECAKGYHKDPCAAGIDRLLVEDGSGARRRRFLGQAHVVETLSGGT